MAGLPNAYATTLTSDAEASTNGLICPLSSQFQTVMHHMGGFEQHPTLAVAVSGGADSMALMLRYKII